MSRTLLSIGCLAMVAVVAISGCQSDGSVAGYRADETFDNNIRTIAMPIFANKTFWRDVEIRLSEALTKQVESRTPWKVTDTSGADTMLCGTVLSVNKRLLSRQYDTAVAQEVQIVITASIEWKDMRNGEFIRKRSRIRGSGEYVPTNPVGDPVEVALHAAVDELAKQIVSLMRNDW